jgi:hypothetical protein
MNELKELMTKVFEKKGWNKQLLDASIEYVKEYYLDNTTTVQKAVRQWMQDTVMNFEDDYKL